VKRKIPNSSFAIQKGDSMKVIFHDDFYQVYTTDPAAAAGRMEAIMDAIGSRVELIEAKPASEVQIALVHEAAQIESVRNMGLYDISALAAGGAIQAATIGLAEPCFGLIRPPGHHASAGSCWGFCYFNNMAVALAVLKHEGAINTGYVLDIDLHFGDGTVNILNRRDYITVHNVEAVDRVQFLDEVSEEMAVCRADVIGISAGFDYHQDDWGGMLRTEDYFEIGCMVRESAKRSGGGYFAVLEGGYNHQVLGANVMALLNGMSAESD
jgi:acetoin utilization deacetylase AcuC-like enzyme